MLAVILAGIAAATVPPDPAPVHAAPPRIAATLLIADAHGQRQGRGSDFLGDRSWALLVTMHDLGAIILSEPVQPNSDFDSCFPTDRVEGWEQPTAHCIAKRLKPRRDGAVPVVILVNDTRSRSSAQAFTCVGPDRAIGEARVYLADLYHPRPDIRAGNRRNAMECLAQAAAGLR